MSSRPNEIAFSAAALAAAFVLGCERGAEPASSPTPSASASVSPSAASSPVVSVRPSASAAPEVPAATPDLDAGASGTEPTPDPRLPHKLSAGSGSTAVKSRDGQLFIAGHDRRARHTHGGEPARIGNVSFTFTNDGARPRRITGKRAEFLRDHGCEAPASTVVARPKLASLVLENDEDPRAETLTLELPPGTSQTVRVGFEPVEAYYAWCNRFAIRVSFSVDGRETLAPVAELAVMRVEPVH